MKYKYKMLIAYDGTNYAGWQIQPNTSTIQETIQKALSIILKQKIFLVAAGRTDAGVHALGQTAHFSAETELDIKKTLYSLNSLLPKDIRIKTIEPVEKDFHARFQATGKTYHYYLSLGPYQPPFDRLYSTSFNYPFDLPLVQQAAKHFIGKHDFTSFANEASKGCAVTKPIKTLKKLNINQVSDSKILFEFEGDGFLYKMVRNIVGTLLDVMAKKIKQEDIPSILAAKDRKKAGRVAPAKGLFLVNVYY